MVCLKNFNLLRQIHGIFFQFLIINVFFHIMLFSQESYWFSISKFFFFNVASIRKLLDFLEIKIQVEEEKTIANNRDWLVNAIVPHSSALPWRIPWMEEPGWLQSMGSLRVGHHWATSLFTFMQWRRKWQPTPLFLPGNPRNRGAWWAAICGVAELDTTDAT